MKINNCLQNYTLVKLNEDASLKTVVQTDINTFKMSELNNQNRKKSKIVSKIVLLKSFYTGKCLQTYFLELNFRVSLLIFCCIWNQYTKNQKTTEDKERGFQLSILGHL